MSYIPSCVLPGAKKNNEHLNAKMASDGTLAVSCILPSLEKGFALTEQKQKNDLPISDNINNGNSSDVFSTEKASQEENCHKDIEKHPDNNARIEGRANQSEDVECANGQLKRLIPHLPKDLAREAENVQQLYYFPLEDDRNVLYAAFYNPKISQASLALIAQSVAKKTKALQNFWNRINVAKDELAGLEVLDEVKEHNEIERSKFCVKNDNDIPKEKKTEKNADKEKQNLLREFTFDDYSLMKDGKKGLPVFNGKECSLFEVAEARIKCLRKRLHDATSKKTLQPALDELVLFGETILPVTAEKLRASGVEVKEEFISETPVRSRNIRMMDESQREEYKAERKKIAVEKSRECVKRYYAKKHKVEQELRAAKEKEEDEIIANALGRNVKQ